MDFTLNIKIDASQKLLEALENISNALVSSSSLEEKTNSKPINGKAATSSKTTKGSEKPAKNSAAITATKQESTDTETTVEERNVTIEELRALVRDKAQAGKREDIKNILTEMGATSVTTLEESLYIEFLTKLEAL